MKAAYADVLQRSATELESGPQVEDVLARLQLHVDMESSALTSLARPSLVTDADVDAAIREAQAAPRVTRPIPLRVTPPVGSGPLGSSSKEATKGTIETGAGTGTDGECDSWCPHEHGLRLGKLTGSLVPGSAACSTRCTALQVDQVNVAMSVRARLFAASSMSSRSCGRFIAPRHLPDVGQGCLHSRTRLSIYTTGAPTRRQKSQTVSSTRAAESSSMNVTLPRSHRKRPFEMLSACPAPGRCGSVLYSGRAEPAQFRV